MPEAIWPEPDTTSMNWRIWDPTQTPDITDRGRTMVEDQAGRARITFIVAKPWEMIKRHNIPKIRFANILNPSEARIWKKPNRAKAMITQMPRDNSEVFGFMIIRQARMGLPRYRIWITPPKTRVISQPRTRPGL